LHISKQKNNNKNKTTPHPTRLCARDDKYGWAVVEKSTNHCVVRWVLNSFDFYLLSYKIINMYIQRLNFSYFACIYLLFRLVQIKVLYMSFSQYCKLLGYL
jgi:hypothetical protein